MPTLRSTDPAVSLRLEKGDMIIVRAPPGSTARATSVSGETFSVTVTGATRHFGPYQNAINLWLLCASGAISFEAQDSAEPDDYLITENELVLNQRNIVFRQAQMLSEPLIVASLGGAGLVNAGTHAYRYALRFADGSTSELSQASNTVTAAPSVVNLIVPLANDSAVVARDIYRSKAGEGNTLAYFLGSIENNSTTGFTDNVADASLGAFGRHSAWQSVNFLIDTVGNGSRQRVLSIDATTIAIGYLCAPSPGYNTTAIGVMALASQNQVGNANTALGNLALNANTLGSGNTGLGYAAQQSNTIGNLNVAVGLRALAAAGSVSGCTVIGANAGDASWAAFSNFNTVVGQGAAAVALTGTNNVFIGVTAATGALQALSATNSIAIGKLAATPRSNMAVIGDNLVVETQLRGSVRISLNDTSLSAPNSLACLDASNHTAKGLLLPQVTTATRDGTMAAAAPGTLIYNTTTGKLNVKGASAWEAVTSA